MITSIIMLAVAAYLWRLGRAFTELSQQRERPPAVFTEPRERPPAHLTFKIGRN